MKTELILRIGFIFWIALGGVTGYFAGENKVLKQIMGDKIECALTINPITMETLK